MCNALELLCSTLASILADPSQWAPEGEAPYFWMLSFLGLTVLFLVLDVVTAYQGKRNLHIVLALTTVPIFLTAIYFADSVGRFWNFDEPWITVHLSFAITGFFTSFIVVGSGALHAFKKLPLVVHRSIAFVFLGLVLFATATGVNIFFHGEKKASKPTSATFGPAEATNNAPGSGGK